MSEETEGKKSHRWIKRLLRLGVLGAVGMVVAKRLKSRSAPSEGLWREGTPRDGLNATERRSK